MTPDSSRPAEARPRALPSGVEITGVVLRSLTYVEDATTTPSPGDPWPDPGAIALTGRIVPQSAETVEFLLEMRARPNSEDGSFGIFIAMSALFTRQPLIETRPFVTFLNRQGGPILFPYMRELVSNVSSRTVYETVNMAPIVLEPLLDESNVDKIVTAVDELAKASSTASVGS